MSKSEENWGWVGFDLDGTIAHHGVWVGPGVIGEPIAPTVALVKQYLKEGQEVRVVTARANRHNEPADLAAFQEAWAAWSTAVFGRVLATTAEKDYRMTVLFDDRAVQVERNTGRLVGYQIIGS